MGQSGWLLYVQVLLFGVILLRQVLRPIAEKRRTSRAERMAAQILRESRDSLRAGARTQESSKENHGKS